MKDQIKNLRWTILISILIASCSGDNSQYVQRAVRLMDKQGLFAEGPEWEAAKAAALSAQPTSLEEERAVVESALKVAGGKHSGIKHADAVKEDAISEWPAPSVTTEDDGIPVIALPPFSGNHDEGFKYANTVLDAIPDNIPGVVIDLRGNLGGNMYPMISAVHRFLPGDNEMLRFRSRKNTQWITLDFVLQGTGIKKQSRIECPVAILTNDRTASSGEATLICFRGLDYVRVFGSSTAGYASANQPFPLPGGDVLVLTTGCDVARTGEVFCDDPIEPDVLTGTPLEDALEWLRSNN